jgi:fucose permease
MSSTFHSFFDIKPASKIKNPEPTYQKSKGKAPQTLDDVGVLPDLELKDFASTRNHHGRQTSGSDRGTQKGAQTPRTPNELEMSRPPTPRADDAIGTTRTWNGHPMTKWRILCCCLIYLSNGINDSGKLLEVSDKDTDRNKPVFEYWLLTWSSCRCSHPIYGDVLPHIVLDYVFGVRRQRCWLHQCRILHQHDLRQVREGKGVDLCRADTAICVCHACVHTAIPCRYRSVSIRSFKMSFLTDTTSFFLLGFGAAINLALNNVFCANTHPPSVVLGLAHGSYGVGGIIAPIIGTAIVSHGVLWSRFYFLTVGLRLCCIAFAAWSFWSYQEDTEETLLEPTGSRQTAAEDAASKLKNLKLALKNRVTIFGALFIFAYQGAEVSISGWFISYLINYRNGDPAKVGYVTAGFWVRSILSALRKIMLTLSQGGITLGRFVLTHAAPKIGEKKFVVILTLGTIGLQLLAWLTPNLIGNAVAVCLLGLLLGPVYPCAQTIFSRLMPRHIQTTAIGFIGGAGSSGGAVAPFTTGILAQASGTWVLHPVCVGMYAVMLACWFALPKVRKRTE